MIDYPTIIMMTGTIIKDGVLVIMTNIITDMTDILIPAPILKTQDGTIMIDTMIGTTIETLNGISIQDLSGVGIQTL